VKGAGIGFIILTRHPFLVGLCRDRTPAKQWVEDNLPMGSNKTGISFTGTLDILTGINAVRNAGISTFKADLARPTVKFWTGVKEQTTGFGSEALKVKVFRSNFSRSENPSLRSWNDEFGKTHKTCETELCSQF